MSAERRARLRLIRSPNIGPVTFVQLLERFGSGLRALAAVPELSRRGGGRGELAPEGVVDDEIAAVAAAGARHLLLGDALYPPLLARLPNAPPALTVRGDLRLLERPAVAIVGARNASAAACRFARMLGHDLAAEGCLVVSGLARGIDTAAHAGALAGGTAAVIASGIDIAFPPENAGLQEEIATRGLLLAEQPPGREPLARHFPFRNRIIAGLAVATVVVEAAPRSGSLITARLAAEAGREVLAVPGSPLDPRAQGCNTLIREGATLIQSAADVLEAIRPLATPGSSGVAQERDGWRGVAVGQTRPDEPADPDADVRARVVALLGPTAVPVDELVRLAHATPQAMQTVLLELELAGRLTRHAGGRVALEA